MNPSIVRTARTAGLFYLLQIPLGIFALVYVPTQYMDINNMELTIKNLQEHAFIFRLGMISAIVCALVTVATAHYISKVLKPVHPLYARLITIFALVVTPISLLNELNHAAILILTEPNPANTSFSPEKIKEAVRFFILLHQYGMNLVHIFFGLWLLPMGWLVIKSGYIPKIIGIFLMITCLGYIIDFTLFYAFPQIKLVLSQFTWPGEVMMVGWLLIKGVRKKAYNTYMGNQMGSDNV